MSEARIRSAARTYAVHQYDGDEFGPVEGAFIAGYEAGVAEERAARASLAPLISKMREAVTRFSDSDDVLSAWMDLDAVLTGASTPAPVPEDGTGGAE